MKGVKKMKIVYMMYLQHIAFINCYKKLGYMSDYEPETFEQYKSRINQDLTKI